jgi:hypothetical protein
MFRLRRNKGSPTGRSGTALQSASPGPQGERPEVLRTTPGVDEAIAAVDAFALPSAATETEFQAALQRIRQGDHAQGPLIWDLHAGLLAFLASAFSCVPRSTLYGQVFTREPQGRGPHFDVYDKILHRDFPWVALFNLAGDAVVSSYPLPDWLATRYALAHPEASDRAYAERRRISEEALADPEVRVTKGYLLAGTGLIIPQQPAGPEWVHNVVPVQQDHPGRFVKFVAAGRDVGALENRGYDLVDDLFRRALVLAPHDGSGDSEIRPRRRCNFD